MDEQEQRGQCGPVHDLSALRGGGINRERVENRQYPNRIDGNKEANERQQGALEKITHSFFPPPNLVVSGLGHWATISRLKQST